jgi:hypothetical protein
MRFLEERCPGEELSWKCAIAAFGFLISEFELSGFPACCTVFLTRFNHTHMQGRASILGKNPRSKLPSGLKFVRVE